MILNRNKVPKDVSQEEEQDVNASSFNSDFSGDLSSAIGGISGILSTAYDIADTGDANYEDELDRIRNQTFSPSGTYSLMNQFNNMYLGSPKGWEDFGGKTAGQYAKGILGSTLSGTAAGAKYGPYGAIGGFILGLGAGTIGMFSNQAQAKSNERYYYNKRNENFNIALNNWNTANDALKTNQYDRALKGFYQSAEDGGLLSTHGSDFTNNIKYINVGGTHEQNPNRGVQMGVDEEGTPNLVEEGEVIFNDYVFSARLKPSKKALNDSLIGDKYLGLTYAEIAEKLAEESEEMPNDKIEQNTLNANFKRLITIQEEQRAKKEQREANMFYGGGPLSRQEYQTRVNRINKEYSDDPIKRQAMLEDALARYRKSDDYKNEKNHELVRMLESKGYKVRSKTAQKTYERLVDKKSANGLTNEEKDELRREYNNIFGNPTGVSSMETGFESNYSIPDDIQQTQQIEQQAAQTAEETVAKSDPTGATSSSNTASTSNGAPSSGTKAPIRDGDIIKPDLTNARVGNGQIQYDRNQNGEAFENQQYYQDFLKYMDSIKNTPEAQEWIDAINAGSFGDMNGYKINSFDDWRRLATDKKVGPVHTATLMAANNWGTGEMARRSMNSDLMTLIATGDPYLNGAFKVQTPKEDIIRESSLASDNEGPTDEEPKDYSYLLRYAPVLGNALALLGNRKDYSDVRRFEAATANPRTVRFSPIGTYIRPNLIAPSELSVPIENQMANERNYISNNSLGNSTASNNYMLASDYLGNSRIGAAYLQGKQYNAEQRQKAAAYNLGIDQYNSEGAFREQQQNMSLNNYYLQRALSDYQMRNNIDMAYNQARSSNLTALFNNLGNIGLDTFNRKRANAASPAYNQLSDGEIAYLRRLIGE